MEYTNIVDATFIRRPNRFIAYCRLDSRAASDQAGPEAATVVHVKNTGRCRELLTPEARVYLEKSANPARKTAYDLIAVEKAVKNGTLLVNMDSQAPNQVFYDALAAGLTLPGQPGPWLELRREVTFGGSRFDLFGRARGGAEALWQAYIEVKGVTLEEDGVVRFPDAPTERGAKHLRELAAAVAAGFAAYVVFVIQMKGVAYFTPHDQRDPAFGQALRQAAAAGVGVLAYDCRVTPGSLRLDVPVPVKL
jgi:sugar fermentation stimulation protein A